MELQQAFTAAVQVRAVLTEDGTARVTLVGSAPYRTVEVDAPDGSKQPTDLTASITIDVTDAEVVAEVQAALQKVLDKGSQRLGSALAQAVYQARAVAAARGEQ